MGRVVWCASWVLAAELLSVSGGVPVGVSYMGVSGATRDRWRLEARLWHQHLELYSRKLVMVDCLTTIQRIQRVPHSFSAAKMSVVDRLLD